MNLHARTVCIVSLDTYCYLLVLSILRKPADRLGVVSPCERSENWRGCGGGGALRTK